MNKLKNIFKLGKKIATISAKLIQVEFQGKKQPAVLYMPYGTFSNPADGNITGLLSDQGNEESMIALVMDIANQETLESGEVAFGIPAETTRIYFREDGHITFKIGDTEGGDFAARFNELKSGFDTLKTDFNNLVTLFNSHPHTGVTTGAGTSGPPATPGTSSVASIDDAKIAEIEFPS